MKPAMKMDHSGKQQLQLHAQPHPVQRTRWLQVLLTCPAAELSLVVLRILQSSFISTVRDSLKISGCSQLHPTWPWAFPGVWQPHWVRLPHHPRRFSPQKSLKCEQLKHSPRAWEHREGTECTASALREQIQFKHTVLKSLNLWLN